MRRAPPRRRRAPHISLPRSAPRQRTKPGASHRRGAARGRGSTAPADGAAAAVDESMRARRWEGRPPAASLSYRRCSNYFAARLPGLDSRRAAACFSSSSPVGAIFACRLLRVLLAASESGWILRGGLVVGPGSCCTPTVARENEQQESSPRGDVAREPVRRPPGYELAGASKPRAAVPVFSPPRATSLSYNYAPAADESPH